VQVPANPASLDGARGEVRFENVSFTYPGTTREVLSDIDFVARPGETVALVGPTGSGKSTIVALLARLYDPTGGRILLDGVPLTAVDPADLRARIGMVPQDPFLFSDTISGNIGLGLDGATRNGEAAQARAAAVASDGAAARAIQHAAAKVASDGAAARNTAEAPESVVAAARIAQLHEQIEEFPRRYGTLLGERGINLSGGQKQRATLARAVARDPLVLVLDDALSAVDTDTETKILKDLRRVLAGRTAFIISHRVSAVMNADQILVLEDGRIVQRGKHADLIGVEGTYARLLRRQLLEQTLESDLVPTGSD
jgi:ATP-binding cassette subfamily B protein